MSKANGSPLAPVSRRLLREYQAYQRDPNPALEMLKPIGEDDLLTWVAVLRGVEGTPYQGGLWTLSIKIPPTYPLAPPIIKFETPICHPNIHFSTGEICLDLLNSGGAWSPAYTLSTTMTAIHTLLTSPEPDSPLNIDVALLLRCGDMLAYADLVRFYTLIHRADPSGKKDETQKIDVEEKKSDGWW